MQEFGAIGAGQWFRYLVGIVELAGAIGLLMPWLVGLAAVWLAADMFAVFVLLAYGRRQQIKRLAAAVRLDPLQLGNVGSPSVTASKP